MKKGLIIALLASAISIQAVKQTIETTYDPAEPPTSLSKEIRIMINKPDGTFIVADIPAANITTCFEFKQTIEAEIKKTESIPTKYDLFLLSTKHEQIPITCTPSKTTCTPSKTKLEDEIASQASKIGIIMILANPVEATVTATAAASVAPMAKPVVKPLPPIKYYAPSLINKTIEKLGYTSYAEEIQAQLAKIFTDTIIGYKIYAMKNEQPHDLIDEIEKNINIAAKIAKNTHDTPKKAMEETLNIALDEAQRLIANKVPFGNKEMIQQRGDHWNKIANSIKQPSGKKASLKPLYTQYSRTTKLLFALLEDENVFNYPALANTLWFALVNAVVQKYLSTDPFNKNKASKDSDEDMFTNDATLEASDEMAGIKSGIWGKGYF